jgi:hypothetical protein
MSLQGGKNRVENCGEREIFYNVYKFMKTESEVAITNVCTKSILDNFDEAVCEKNST